MSRTAIIASIAILGVAIAGAAGSRLIFYEPAPEPALTSTSTPISNPPLTIPVPTPTPTSTSTPNPPPTSTTCTGISNRLAVEFDGKSVLSMTSPAGTVHETINGGESFSLTASANFENNRIEKQVFVIALRLARGVRTPNPNDFRIEYREYDRSTNPYTQTVLFTPAMLTGQVHTYVTAADTGEHVCGTFDVRGTGVHTIRVSGSFNQVMPPLRLGGQ